MKNLVHKLRGSQTCASKGNDTAAACTAATSIAAAKKREDQDLPSRLGGMQVLGAVCQEFSRRAQEDVRLPLLHEDPHVLTLHPKTFFRVSLSSSTETD